MKLWSRDLNELLIKTERLRKEMLVISSTILLSICVWDDSKYKNIVDMITKILFGILLETKWPNVYIFHYNGHCAEWGSTPFMSILETQTMYIHSSNAHFTNIKYGIVY